MPPSPELRVLSPCMQPQHFFAPCTPLEPCRKVYVCSRYPPNHCSTCCPVDVTLLRPADFQRASPPAAPRTRAAAEPDKEQQHGSPMSSGGVWVSQRQPACVLHGRTSPPAAVWPATRSRYTVCPTCRCKRLRGRKHHAQPAAHHAATARCAGRWGFFPCWEDHVHTDRMPSFAQRTPRRSMHPALPRYLPLQPPPPRATRRAAGHAPHRQHAAWCLCSTA